MKVRRTPVHISRDGDQIFADIIIASHSERIALTAIDLAHLARDVADVMAGLIINGACKYPDRTGRAEQITDGHVSKTIV